jgi:hypothetical protein
MAPRWMLISYLIFGLFWLFSGIWMLNGGDTGTGIGSLALGIGYLLVAAFKSMRPAASSERRSGAR